jgi:hypothetical protein
MPLFASSVDGRNVDGRNEGEPGSRPFTREFPFQIGPEFLEDIRGHVDSKLTGKF